MSTQLAGPLRKIMKTLIPLAAFFVLILVPFYSPAVWRYLQPGDHGDRITGQWVGIVDMQKGADGFAPLQENRGNTVLTVTLRPSLLTRVSSYRGKGEIRDEDGNIRTFDMIDVTQIGRSLPGSGAPAPNAPGRLAGFLQATGGDSEMQGSLEGEFEPGKLTLTQGTRTGSFRLQGILRKGTDADAKRLYNELTGKK